MEEIAIKQLERRIEALEDALVEIAFKQTDEQEITRQELKRVLKEKRVIEK